jgi:hypothetical protein
MIVDRKSAILAAEEVFHASQKTKKLPKELFLKQYLTNFDYTVPECG